MKQKENLQNDLSDATFEAEAKKENVKKTKKENIIYVDLAKFEYIGDEPYYHKDLNGKNYVFNKNDIIYLKEGGSAYYFDYKTTLFKRLVNE